MAVSGASFGKPGKGLVRFGSATSRRLASETLERAAKALAGR